MLNEIYIELFGLRFYLGFFLLVALLVLVVGGGYYLIKRRSNESYAEDYEDDHEYDYEEEFEEEPDNDDYDYEEYEDVDDFEENEDDIEEGYTIDDYGNKVPIEDYEEDEDYIEEGYTIDDYGNKVRIDELVDEEEPEPEQETEEDTQEEKLPPIVSPFAKGFDIPEEYQHRYNRINSFQRTNIPTLLNERLKVYQNENNLTDDQMDEDPKVILTNDFMDELHDQTVDYFYPKYFNRVYPTTVMNVTNETYKQIVNYWNIYLDDPLSQQSDAILALIARLSHFIDGLNGGLMKPDQTPYVRTKKPVEAIEGFSDEDNRVVQLLLEIKESLYELYEHPQYETRKILLPLNLQHGDKDQVEYIFKQISNQNVPLDDLTAEEAEQLTSLCIFYLKVQFELYLYNHDLLIEHDYKIKPYDFSVLRTIVILLNVGSYEESLEEYAQEDEEW